MATEPQPGKRHEERESGAASSDDDDGFDNEGEEVTLSSIKTSKTMTFSIHASYTNWEPREAFREFVQNWRDGIVKSFNLAEHEFQVVREAKTEGHKTEIVFKVPRPKSEPPEWLGFIRFKGTDGKGTIQVTNRMATIQPWHLNMGASGKTDSKNQAGAHGEGLKVALLVLMRGAQNHSVRFSSGGFNTRFDFTTSGKLVARLRRMSSAATRKVESQSQRECAATLQPFAPNPRKDVEFTIGEPISGHTERGEEKERQAVTLEEFNHWTTAALFLQEHEEGHIVSTDQGDLILDCGMGSIYLKGLLLNRSTFSCSASVTGKRLRYSYNFASGTTNRDRVSVADTNKESKTIIAIWGKALEIRPELVQNLSTMLNEKRIDYADVSGAKQHIDKTTASKLKSYLISHKEKWYYAAEDAQRIGRLPKILNGISYKGSELSRLHWDIMQKHGLLRTAEQEERRRFTSAPPAPVGQTTFATLTKRLLEASLLACPATDCLAVEFVKAGPLNLDICYEESISQLKIHERWLSRDGALGKLISSGHLKDFNLVVRAVCELFDDALRQLPKEKVGSREERLELAHNQKQMVGHLHLIDFKVNKSPEQQSVSVTWPVEPDWADGTGVEIQCHSSTVCPQRRKKLLLANGAVSQKMPCLASQDFPCRLLTAKTTDGKKRGEGLKENHKYFFLFLVPSDPTSVVMRVEPAQVNNAPAASAPKKKEPDAASFTVGDRLEKLDILTIGEDRWFNASGPNGKAVIGFPKGENLPPAARKRRRLL